MKFKLRLIGSVILISFYSFTNDKKDDSASINDYLKASQNNGVFIDKINDVEKSFVDLNSLSINIDSDIINIKIGLLDLTDNLTFNQTLLTLNSLNYEWSVYFDIDNSNSLTKGDLSISVMKFKFSDSFIISKDIKGETQQNISEYNGDTWDVTMILKDYFDIKNSKFIYSIPKTLYSSLNSINSNTNIYFKAYYNDGSKQYCDYYPDRK
jgi:hypothetical protein